MSTSLLHQLSVACLVCFTEIVCETGGKWTYGCCFLGCCFKSIICPDKYAESLYFHISLQYYYIESLPLILILKQFYCH